MSSSSATTRTIATCKTDKPNQIRRERKEGAGDADSPAVNKCPPRARQYILQCVSLYQWTEEGTLGIENTGRQSKVEVITKISTSIPLHLLFPTFMSSKPKTGPRAKIESVFSEAALFGPGASDSHKGWKGYTV